MSKWRTFCLLALTFLSAFDFRRASHAREIVDSNKREQPKEKEVVTNSERSGEQEVTEGAQIGLAEALRRPYREEFIDEESTGLVGKWRSTGEAIEPKWRDGDSVPLLPFSHLPRPYAKGILDRGEEEIEYESDQRDTNYQNGRGQLKNYERVQRPRDYEDYDLQSRRHRYSHRGNLQVRRRNPHRPSVDFNNNSSEEISESEGSTIRTRYEDEGSKNREKVKDPGSTGYRAAFQTHPNAYVHELTDEEYLKPRPRKRRPPQNYEFALAANEASLLEEKDLASSRTTIKSKKNETQDRSVQIAMELKALLKMQQQEGLSLSEILQRRNLTLNDLLKGRAEVISALKSKDVDDFDQVMEEASRAMSNSLNKISVTERPRWPATLKPEETKVSETENDLGKVNISMSDAPNIVLEASTSLGEKDLAGAAGVILHDAGWFNVQSKVKDATTGKSILVTLGPSKPDGTSSRTTSTIVATTPIVPSLESSSGESFQHEVVLSDANEMKPDSLDEDEIMEFSDFTDFKKATSTESMPTKSQEGTHDRTIGQVEKNRPDVGSTLSIEHILGPTERGPSVASTSEIILPNDDCARAKDNGGKYFNDDSSGEDSFSDEFNSFVDPEYQDDAPSMDFHDDLERVTGDGEDEKIKMSEIVWKEDKILTSDPDNVTYLIDNPLENHHNETSESKPYEDIISEIEPEARAEIFELFASGSSGKRLERLLKSRNMSVEELIALRQRGSSKVHLAEVSRLRKEKTPRVLNGHSEINTDGTLQETKKNKNIVTIIDNEEEQASTPKDVINGDNKNYIHETSLRKASSLQTSPESSTLNHPNVASITEIYIDIKKESSTTPPDESSTRREDKDDHLSIIQNLDLFPNLASFPFGKNINQDFAPVFADYSTTSRKATDSEKSIGTFAGNEAERTRNTSNSVESGYVEEIIEKGSDTLNALYGQSRNEENTDERRGLSKVRPSIIASGAILGVTIIVFLAIFIACRIRQKQKYTYRNTFSRAVFQGPVLAARKLSNSSSLSTVMVNVVATSTTRRPDKNDALETAHEFDPKSDIDDDSLDANDSWETIPDYMK